MNERPVEVSMGDKNGDDKEDKAGRHDERRDGDGEAQTDKWSNWGDAGDNTGKHGKN
ncbi:hypothetical protein [Amycolatopsis sp. NPDC059021]|uniref:hypothetical protein n=1 Tax=Amycolatopsis sp. NPDC059021 TaxID=3346704 RepID=UPI00366C76C1